MLKILFFFRLEWLEILKDSLKSTTQLWLLKFVLTLSFLSVLNLSYA